MKDFVNGLDYAGVFDTYYQDASSCYRKLEGQVENLPVILWPRGELEACASNFQLPSSKKTNK